MAVLRLGFLRSGVGNHAFSHLVLCGVQEMQNDIKPDPGKGREEPGEERYPLSDGLLCFYFSFYPYPFDGWLPAAEEFYLILLFVLVLLYFSFPSAGTEMCYGRCAGKISRPATGVLFDLVVRLSWFHLQELRFLWQAGRQSVVFKGIWRQKGMIIGVCFMILREL